MKPVTPSKLEFAYRDACRIRASRRLEDMAASSLKARKEAEEVVPSILKDALCVAEAGISDHYSVSINQMNPSTKHIMQLLLEGGYNARQTKSGDEIMIAFEQPPDVFDETLSMSSKDCASTTSTPLVPRYRSWIQQFFGR